MDCSHVELELIIRHEEYKHFTSYKEGNRPYECKSCGELFWAKPLTITVMRKQQSAKMNPETDPQ